MSASVILEKVRTALRFKHNQLDDELNDLIESAMQDLQLAGVVVEADAEPVIVEAIKTYCRAHMTDDKSKAELFEARYDKQKSVLKCTRKFGEYLGGDGESDAE